MTAATDTTTRDRVVRSIRRVPVDGVAALGGLLLADVVLLSTTSEMARLLVGLPLLFFLPGYALLTALFPRGAATDAPLRARIRAGREPVLSLGERAALSFGTSLALLPPLALLLAATGLGVTSPAVFVSLTLVTGLGLLVGIARRLRLPESERYTLPLGRWSDALSGATDAAPGTLAVNAALVVAVLVSLSALTGALLAPRATGAGTEFTVLTENESGEYVASGYPSSVSTGEEVPLVVGVTNHDHREHTYVIVAELERVETTDGETSVVESQELRRLVVTAGANETIYEPHTVEPALAGDDLRLTYHLYRGQAPDDADHESADRTLHVWVDVTP